MKVHLHSTVGFGKAIDLLKRKLKKMGSFLHSKIEKKVLTEVAGKESRKDELKPDSKKC